MAGVVDSPEWQAHLAEDSSWFPLRCSIIAIVMVTVAYAFRFWARTLQAAPWGWFDWLMIPAYLCMIGLCVSGILAAEWGSGRHIELMYYGSDYDFDRWGLLTFYISGFVYMGAITLPRLSIICLYRKIFRDKYSKWAMWAVVFLMLARSVAEAVVLFLQCDHFKAAWHFETWSGHCRGNLLAHYTYSRIPNIVADVILLLIPMPTLWQLKLSTEVKIGLIATFCLGAFGLVTAVIGLAAFAEGMSSYDLTWVNGPMMSWSVLEAAAYFTSACMLTYKPLVLAVVKVGPFKRAVSWYSTYTSNNKSTSPSSRGDLYPDEKSLQILKEVDTRVSHTDIASNPKRVTKPLPKIPAPARKPVSVSGSHISWPKAASDGRGCGTCENCLIYQRPCNDSSGALTHYLDV